MKDANADSDSDSDESSQAGKQTRKSGKHALKAQIAKEKKIREKEATLRQENSG
jgi:hypothetical protein